ncbi:glycosyltransferase [Kribbella sp. NPDC051620]|uniref:glycosyltransferase n=1 Tax=Kribbella sp. NPDC051620 TaxID=3364120 RepID=UPI0037952BF8
MRIAMVSEHASPLAVLGGADAGGQNVHVAALSLALADRGHQVEVYTRREDPAIAERVELGPDVDVIHVPAGPPEPIPKDELLPHMPAFGQWLGSRWAASPPQVVHAHFWMSGLACRPARQLADFPYAQTFHALGVIKRRHQGRNDTSPPERLRIETGLALAADAVIATATDEVTELLALGARAETLHVVPCGVDQFPGTTADDRWWTDGHQRILSLGRLVERKGVDTVIAALAELPTAELVIAGGPVTGFDDDHEVRRLRAEADRLGLTDRVRLVGPVSRAELPGLLRSADVVACTPWYEPFGIVPLEAMACGRPVVGSAVGGLLDTVVDGVTGLLVPPRDPAALSTALATLLADPALRQRLGQAGSARVAAKYTWPKVAAATEQIYRRIAAPVAAGKVS